MSSSDVGARSGVVKCVSVERPSIGEGEGERCRRALLRGTVVGATLSDAVGSICHDETFFERMQSPSSSLLDSSERVSKERLLDDVDRREDVREELGECTRRLGSEFWFFRRL